MSVASAQLQQPAPVPASQRIEELGRIIMAYSEVTERLQHSHDQLKQQVEQLREELSEKNRLLERKNRLAALGEMAAGMAHEIRNPLGGIQLYASLLMRDLADRPASAELVGKISACVKRLESLVSQVLHFTREINVHAVPMDLAQVVAQTVDLVAGQASDKGIRLCVQGPQTLRVVADPVLIGQALLNLLLNAIEAMEQPGQIELRYGPPTRRSQARQFQLTVRDTGPGIPSEIIDRIFDPFFTTKETGTGLGLAIVHRVVEAHEGTIMAGNAPEGGARFEVRI
ncbi:sensor histidine kinase [Fontivita pretiosa]|uniref:sensor histidine kinase n=1 Tax=Fontivita pretiosa TaxID=2989684 RepID=UPI003D163D45